MLLLRLSLVSCAAASFIFPTRLIFQSPTGLFLENLAVRPNGKLLLTSPQSPTLHMLDPTAEYPTLNEVYTFPNVTLTGIAEVQPDIYGLVTSVLNFTTTRAVPGTIAVWRVDLRSEGPPVVSKAADVPDAGLLNGLSTVPGEPDLVLGADSAAGRVWQINLRTGAVRIAAQDDAFSPAGAPAPALGINGLHVHDSDLYFTNSQQKTFSRVPISARGGKVTQSGPVQVLGSTNATDQFDDFTLDAEGRAWVATDPDTLTLFFGLVQGNGLHGQLNAPGSPIKFGAPTSAAFGRGRLTQEHTLYVTTQTGQLVAVDTNSLRV